VKWTRGCFVAYVLVAMLIFSAAVGTASAPSGAANAVTAHTNAAGSTASSQLHTKLLAISDLPAGWFTTSLRQGSAGSGAEGCTTSFIKDDAFATIGFISDYDGLQLLDETLQSGPDAASLYSETMKRPHICNSPPGGTVVKAMSFPTMGIESSAYTLSASFAGEKLNADIVVFTQGPYVGSLALGARSQVDRALLQTLFTKAITQLSATATERLSSGAVVVTCTTLTRHEASCLAPGWGNAYSITFSGRVPKNLGACLTRDLPRGYRYLFETLQSNGEPSTAEQNNTNIIQSAMGRCTPSAD
jgi:hypothetical protein